MPTTSAARVAPMPPARASRCRSSSRSWKQFGPSTSRRKHCSAARRRRQGNSWSTCRSIMRPATASRQAVSSSISAARPTARLTTRDGYYYQGDQWGGDQGFYFGGYNRNGPGPWVGRSYYPNWRQPPQQPPPTDRGLLQPWRWTDNPFREFFWGGRVN